MKRRIIALLLCVILLCSVASVSVFAARDVSLETALASELKELGLFRGVSDTNFDLERAPTRLEALIMLIRVLGKEDEALNGTWSHPFDDVPDWGAPYVGYAYEKHLTQGVSSTKFGTGSSASAAMYLTFVLRALNYSDAIGDFVWDQPYTLAKSIGILPDRVDRVNFWRADVVLISYAALGTKLKGSSTTLSDKLISLGVFSFEKFYSLYDPAKLSSVKVEMDAEQIYAKCSPAVFYIEVYNRNGLAIASGSGFFIDSKGTAVTNYHVIEGASSAKITVSDTGKVYDVAGVYDFNSDGDWAVLKINGSGFNYLQIADRTTVVGGATVYAIGSPLGLQNSITQGIISNVNRVEEGNSYIQTSAAISHGSSGGALINKNGEVIGITSASYTEGQNLNLALPISVVDGYRSTAVTPLSELAYPELPSGDADIFSYLLNYTLTYNVNSDAYPMAYLDEYWDSDYDVATLLSYDRERDEIDLVMISVTSDESFQIISDLTFTRTCSGSYTAALLVESTYQDTNLIATVNAATFNANTLCPAEYFDGGSSLLRTFQESLTSSLVLSLLSLEDTVLYPAGYDLTDLGFYSL